MRVGPLSGQAATAIGTTINARPTAMSYKTKRQRGEGGRPVGKSRNMRGKVIKPVANTQVKSHERYAPPGQGPGSVTSA
jgi:hypothetical protein